MEEFAANLENGDGQSFSWISPLGVESSLEQLLEYGNQCTDDGRILDVGCGDGKLTAALADRYPDYEVHGIDPDPEAIARAKERTGDLPNASVARTILDSSTHDADLVYAINCVQATSDPSRTIADIHSTIRDGGGAIITAPTVGTEQLFVEPARRADHATVTESDDLLENEFGSFRGELHYEDDLIEQRLYDTSEGDSLLLSQYTIKPAALERFCDEAGFEIVETKSLTCGMEGILYFLELFEFTEALETWQARVERWREDPASVPDDNLQTVSTFYLEP